MKTIDDAATVTGWSAEPHHDTRAATEKPAGSAPIAEPPSSILAFVLPFADVAPEEDGDFFGLWTTERA